MLYHLIIDENSSKNSVKVYEEDQIIVVNVPSLQEAICKLQALGNVPGQESAKNNRKAAFNENRLEKKKEALDAKGLYLFHKRNNYKGCFPRICGGGTADAAADFIKMRYDVTDEGLQEGQAAMLCFNLWQDVEVMGRVESADRHIDAYKAFYGENMTNYNYFRGFIGGLDFYRFTENLIK